MTRDKRKAEALRRLSLAASRAFDEVCDLKAEALDSDALLHARLYDRIADELADAMSHLDCAAVLMDPDETSVENWES